METDNNPGRDTKDLADELYEDIRYFDASAVQRFLNWLIDNLVLRFGLSYLTVTPVVYVWNMLFPDYIAWVFSTNDQFHILLIGYVIMVLNYFLYYPICEKGFRGYTVGKLITGTRAIRLDGAELSFRDALLRTLCRLVPFEAFSGLGYYPWHDKWTNTRVIQSR